MKKIFAFTVSLIIVICSFTACSGKTENTPEKESSSVDTQSVSVYVSIADKIPQLTWVKVNVTDADNDGALTICDALYCAHEQYFKDGADGFGYEETEYGLSLTKLGGISDGASFGYYHNNASAMSLLDEVSDNDYVYAFVYSDNVNYSDVYCYFDQNTISTQATDGYTLTVYSCGFDENWAPVTAAFEGAEITIDGEKTGIITDENGKAVIALTEGDHIISAVSDTVTIVPPVCTARVTK